jgi:hypothetical protein
MPRLIVPSSGGGKKLMRTTRVDAVEDFGNRDALGDVDEGDGESSGVGDGDTVGGSVGEGETDSGSADALGEAADDSIGDGDS